MPITLSELSLVGRLTLLLLLGLSVVSWGVMVERGVRYLRAKNHFVTFKARLNRSGTFNDLYSAGKASERSPAARVVANLALQAERERDNVALERYAKILGEAELGQSETGLPVLATIGSTSPFIGLFGTVWGIIDAFVGIGKYGSPNLAVVAPGIAEALICTAAGLVVAVPAVVGYNYFVARVRDEARRIEQTAETVLILHRRMNTGERS